MALTHLTQTRFRARTHTHNRLAQLLTDEQETYEREIEATFETPAQRKERLFARAKALRARREGERKALVAQLEFERVRAGTDDLRKLDSVAFLQETVAQRAAQLKEAEDAKVKEAEEAKEHTAAWEANRQTKIEREIREAEEAKARDDEMKLALNAQVELHAARVQADKDAEAAHAAKMLELWEAEAAAAKAKAEARAEVERLERVRVRRENEVTASARAKDANKEFLEDKARLDAALAREAAEEAAEKAAYEARRHEAMEHRKRLEEQMAVEKEEQSGLDKLYADEQEKEWRKREAQWNAEADARERLMRDVDASRKANIAMKEAEAAKAKEDDKVIAERIEREIVEEAEREAAEKAARRAKDQAHQVDIFNQMRMKEEAEVLERQKTFLEGKLMTRAEEEYQASLAAMKAQAPPPRNFRRKTANWYD